ncbi:hypothetical protein [Pararhodobacter sp.]|uniref:hypothetical protein n=1 Tax=Pararhodobacter sp. TaxID=2127056 RepID=UPI002FDCF9C4
MTGIAKTGPPLWMRLALWVSTARWHPPRGLSDADKAILFAAARDGWWFRRASPRWDAVWRPYACALARVRVVVLPGKGFGMSTYERMALSWLRLAQAGLRTGTTDPLTLQSAERKRRQSLAPVWLNNAAGENGRRGGRR